MYCYELITRLSLYATLLYEIHLCVQALSLPHRWLIPFSINLTFRVASTWLARRLSVFGGAARTHARAPDAAGGASRAAPPPRPAHPHLIDVSNRLPSLWEI